MGFIEFVFAWIVLFVFCYRIFLLMDNLIVRHKAEIAAIKKEEQNRANLNHEHQ